MCRSLPRYFSRSRRSASTICSASTLQKQGVIFGCNTLHALRFYRGLRTSAGTGCFSWTSSVLRMDRGLVMRRCLEDVLSLWGLKLRECAFCAACEGGGHIWSAAKGEGPAPCSVAESLRRDDADTEVGPETGPQKDHGAHHATRTRLAAPWMN